MTGAHIGVVDSITETTSRLNLGMKVSSQPPSSVRLSLVACRPPLLMLVRITSRPEGDLIRCTMIEWSDGVERDPFVYDAFNGFRAKRNCLLQKIGIR